MHDQMHHTVEQGIGLPDQRMSPLVRELEQIRQRLQALRDEAMALRLPAREDNRSR